MNPIDTEELNFFFFFLVYLLGICKALVQQIVLAEVYKEKDTIFGRKDGAFPK